MWPDNVAAPKGAANGGANGRANGQHAELVVRSHAIRTADEAAGGGQAEAKARQEALGAQQAAASRQPVAAGGLSTAGMPLITPPAVQPAIPARHLGAQQTPAEALGDRGKRIALSSCILCSLALLLGLPSSPLSRCEPTARRATRT